MDAVVSKEFEIAAGGEVKTTVERIGKAKQFTIDYILNFSPKPSLSQVKIQKPIPEYLHPYPPVLRKADSDQQIQKVSPPTVLRDSDEDVKAPSPTITPPTSGKREMETIGKKNIFFFN